MTLTELVLRAPAELVEPVCDALMEELDAVSVSVEDADADTEAEQALFGEPGLPAPAPGWNRSTIRVAFADEEAATQAATLLLAQEWTTGLSVEAIGAVPEADWVRLTQSQFEPVAVTDDFWVVPTWHEVPQAARIALRLDPGMAFGTGTHPTTRMCLRWIATQAMPKVQGWRRVLDYGCGSGILAIGAGLCGARNIEAVDIDPDAVEATRLNAEANGVPLVADLPDRASGSYDLVVANILASPLKLLAPLLCAHVAEGGDLILAGILSRQAAELQQAYAPWLSLQVQDEEDGWILMTAHRPVGGAAMA